MELSRALVVVVSVSAALAGCFLAADFDGLSGGGESDAAGDVTASESGGPADASDAGARDGSLDAALCGDATAGPAMIPSAGFCVDATEVTQKDYFAFLVEKSGDYSGQPTECTWNTSYGTAPSCAFSQTSTLPVSGIDWCDAHAYCKWAGKRLCGRIGGGSEDPGSAGATAANAWYAACSNFGTNAFPYGNVYDGKKCNGRDREAGVVLPVGTSGCEGSLPGLLDMSGNVEEWTDLCSPATDGGGLPKDLCARRGGDYGEEPLSLRCQGINNGYRDSLLCYVGFRCCADVAQ